MDLKDVAALLGWKREEVVIAIETGMELPQSKKRIKLLTNTRNGYDIDENDLDVFIAAFEDEEPGRHPPVGVRRTLLVEASHRCAICGDPAPLQFHHILDSRPSGYGSCELILELDEMIPNQQ